MKVFGECFFYEYYLSIFVTATNKQIYLPMPNSSACRGKKQCAQCPKAVDNAIIYASHLRGFHLPARKCEENIIIFLLKGEVWNAFVTGSVSLNSSVRTGITIL